MEKILVKAKKIIVGDALEAKENAGLLLEDGKISKIYDNMAQAKVPEDARVIDYGDATVLPGLIDCHNHLALDTRLENHLVKMEDCEAEQTIRAVKTMKDDLVSGVTTSRCCGDRFYIDVTCRKAQREGRLLGPKLVVSGIGMRAAHGHGYVGMPHTGPSEFQHRARENILKGVDFLKIFTTKVINATDFIFHFMTPEEMRTVVREGGSVNLPTACHVSGGQGLDDCIDAGVNCLEHVYYITQKQADRVKKEDRWVVYTPSYALNETLLYKFSPLDKEGSQREKEKIVKSLTGAIATGLKFGIGTDGIHQGLAQEVCYVSELGASNRDALAGVTINAARLCRVDAKTGSIVEGKAADLIAVKGNPLDDVSALKNIVAVIQDGNVIV